MNTPINNPVPSLTFALIVTYADRSDYVESLSRTFFSMGISKIIIVDNGSSASSEAKLNILADSDKTRILLKRLKKNEGTAAAFRIGMETAFLDPGCEYLWILDDDNIPDPDALDALFRVWNLIEIEEKSYMLMLSSYRDTKPIYRRAVLTNNPDMIIGHRNHFRAFHLGHVINSFSRKKKVLHPQEDTVSDFGEISAAPYGGMFFHKNLLRTIGYPDSRFYIYCDDHEFSHRLKLRGGTILAVLSSNIRDVEASWNSSGMGIFNIAKHENPTLLYYSVRNRIFLELRFTVNNYITYFVNAMIYVCTVVFFSAISLRFDNMLAFSRAVWDGFSGRMRMHKKYVLHHTGDKKGK
jgi:GT2 family glycosyltransferase